MKKLIVLDTETTGLNPKDGHRLIEIGCMVLRDPLSPTFHHYVNPQRDIDAGAVAVHGITRTFLRDKPLFSSIVESFLDYVRDAILVIHNAPFDVGFINHELQLCDPNLGAIEDYCEVIDTLAIARKKHPGQKNSLDALCKRYKVDNTHRDLHGALLDAKILGQVYLAMIGGQRTLLFGDEQAENTGVIKQEQRALKRTYDLPVYRATSEELSAHEKMMTLVDKE